LIGTVGVNYFGGVNATSFGGGNNSLVVHTPRKSVPDLYPVVENCLRNLEYFVFTKQL
jgi:hypothetical protein